MDASAYMTALQAMAAAAQRAAEAQDRLLASIKATQDLMDAMATGAAEAAAAEGKLAEASAGAAAAEGAAAGAAESLAKSNADAGRAAATAASMQAALNARLRAGLAAETGLATAADQLKDVLEALAFTEQVVDSETEKLNQAWFDGAVMARLEAQQAEALASADAALAAGVRVANDALAQQVKDLAILAAASKLAAEESTSLAKGQAAIAAALAAVSITRGVGALGTFVHWVIAGGAELAAVLIPALIALGAGMAVAAQGAQNAYTHMSALYTATEATANQFHQTIGSALGLGSALQRMQNLANPVVYSILGGAVLALHGSFSGLASVGLEVLRVFQDFSAKVVADFQSGGMGGQLHALLAGMVTDLTQFAQILGNIGHALLNFAAAMPGLAHVLLGVADGISQVILWISRLPSWLITTVMVFEEAWRWGGLLASIVLRLATAFGALGTLGLPMVVAILTQFGTMVQSVALGFGIFFENIGKLIAAIPVFAAETDAAGAAVAGFGGAMFDAVSGISAWQIGLGVLAAAGLGFLIDKLVTARTAVVSMTTAMQSSVDKASGFQVFAQAGANVSALTGKIAAANAGIDSMAQHMGMSRAQFELWGRGAAADANLMLGQLHAGLTQQQRDMLGAAQAATFLTDKYGVGFVGALQLGTQAGIRWDAGIGKMSAAAAENLIKVSQLVEGYKLMGQSAGAVGKDATVIGIESALAATKIGQMTQAWQQWIGQVTGGTSSLATFEQGLHNIGSVASSTAGTLFQATGRMSNSTRQFAVSLEGFTGKSAQNWQNFDQVVQTGAQNFITWMQTAGAMGVVSGQQMDGAIKGIVNQLLPFASHSLAARTALAQLDAQTGQTVAPTMKALEAFNKGGDSARQLARFVQEATARMGNMSQVAQNLGAVMQNDLVNMFDKARLAQSGLTPALAALSNAMHAPGTSATVLHGDILNVVAAMTQLHVTIPTITGMLNILGIHASEAGVKALIMGSHLGTAAGKAVDLGGKMVTLKNNVDKAASSMGSHAAAAANDAAKVADSAGKIADQASKASQAVDIIKAHADAMQHSASAASGLAGQVNSLNGKMSTASGTAQHLSTQYQQAGNQAKTAAAQVLGFHTQIDNAASAALTASAKMAQFAGAMQHAGAMAVTATGEVHALAAAIAALQSKTITITTTMVTNAVHRAGGGPVAAGFPYQVGERGTELFVPSQSGYIIPAPQAHQVAAAAAVQGSASSRPASSPPPAGGEPPGILSIQMDKREVARALMPELWRFMSRNRGAVDGVLSPR